MTYNTDNYMEQGGSKLVIGGELEIANGGSMTNAGAQASAIANMTENSGALGGTQDGDLPDLSSPQAALTENSGAIGGTNDGDLPDLTTPSASLNAEAVREVATGVNGLQSDVGDLIEAVRENADKINDILAALRGVGIIASS